MFARIFPKMKHLHEGTIGINPSLNTIQKNRRKHRTYLRSMRGPGDCVQNSFPGRFTMFHRANGSLFRYPFFHFLESSQPGTKTAEAPSPVFNGGGGHLHRVLLMRSPPRPRRGVTRRATVVSRAREQV